VISSSENAAGGTVVTADGAVEGIDFAGQVNAGLMRDGSVTILSGVHGDAAGGIEPALQFLAEDMSLFGHIDGVTVHNFNLLTEGEIRAMLNGPGTTIGAFCHSGVCLAPFR